MKTVDIFLQELVKNNFYHSNIAWKIKDKKILESLHHQLKNGVFLTENQGNLLIKILKDYWTDLEKNTSIDSDLLDNPTWSKEFRLIDIIKNIYLQDNNFSEIFIEFSYNKKIKDKLFNFTKVFDGAISPYKNNVYSVPLTETNIFLLVEHFQEHNFIFDEKILNFYKEIIDIKNKETVSFDIKESSNVNLLKKLSDDIGSDNTNNSLLLHDRKLKYQYNFNESLDENSLESLIAKRTETDIFVSSNSWSFEQILKALHNLKRLPVLVLFDLYNISFCKNVIETINHSFKNSGIEEKVGIYFRLDNNGNKDFNSRIAELGYNSYLDSNTTMIGLSNKQLPKFIIKTGWKPSSVICFSPTFKNSKIYSYCDTVDLRICYTESKPVSGFDYAIM